MLLKEDWALSFARIEWYDSHITQILSLSPCYYYSHYFVHGGWFESDEYILDNVDKIRHIPGVILQGRYDMVTPMKTAWQLHRVCYTKSPSWTLGYMRQYDGAAWLE